MTNRNDGFKNEPVIVIGSGIAGLLLSIELAESGCKVKLLTKGSLNQSNTAWAQGGLAAVTGGNVADSKEQHLADTLASGDGLTDPIVAERITGDGAKLVYKLAQHGVAFDPSSLALEGGHHMARVLHTADATGRTIVAGLIKTALSKSNIEIVENCFLKQIITESNISNISNTPGRAVGVIAIMGGASMDPDKDAGSSADARESHEVFISGRAIVLATGGLGQVFARTTNPGTATGDGIAAAYKAGAHLADMEFVQFHPTALHLEGAPAFLISEAARGAGAVLLDKHGDRFAHLYHSAGELATRDIVSRAIHMCMKEQNTQNVWLDMRRLGEKALLHQFPTIVAKLRTFGLDPVTEFVPVSPAAHYFMGGILADEFGRTTVQNLYAIGECACTGLHGANRLASNSLLEGGVMALNLAELLSNHCTTKSLDLPIATPSALHLDARVTASIDPNFIPANFQREEFKTLLLHNVGLVRNADSLSQVLQKYKTPAPNAVADEQSAQSSIQTKDLNTAAQIESAATYLLGMLITQSAQLRQESRGAHWRQDYPKTDDIHYRSRLLWHSAGYSWMALEGSIPQINTSPVAAANN